MSSGPEDFDALHPGPVPAEEHAAGHGHSHHRHAHGHGVAVGAGFFPDESVAAPSAPPLEERPGGLLFLVENTSEGKGSPRWRFRREEDYRRLFPAIDLAHLYDYFDVGERISVLAGRKAVAG